uniref:Uncharacterized protein n=1 Tax=Cucumis melo TaxID=3656 RepID=A0A9I9ED29_CUCME
MSTVWVGMPVLVPFPSLFLHGPAVKWRSLMRRGPNPSPSSSPNLNHTRMEKPAFIVVLLSSSTPTRH